MKANNEKYNAEWTSANCGEDFGTMEVVDNATREVVSFPGILFPRTSEGLLKRAEFWMTRMRGV